VAAILSAAVHRHGQTALPIEGLQEFRHLGRQENLYLRERQDERDDRNTLMIYRLIYNTNSMNADTDYIEMAQLLSDAAG